MDDLDERWGHIGRLATAYGYGGPTIPVEPTDQDDMASALMRAMAAVGTPAPVNVEAWDVLQRALRAEYVLPDPVSGRPPQRED